MRVKGMSLCWTSFTIGNTLWISVTFQLYYLVPWFEVSICLCLTNFSSPDPMSTPSRKNFYAEAYQFCQLKGVGGPGAPHHYQLERLGDTGDSISNIFEYPRMWTSYRNFYCIRLLLKFLDFLGSPNRNSTGRSWYIILGPKVQCNQQQWCHSQELYTTVNIIQHLFKNYTTSFKISML